MNKDEEHLRLLSIFHYILAAVTAFFSLFPIIHIVIGLVMIYAPEEMGSHGTAPPPALGWMFVVMGSVIIVLGETMAILQLFAGRFLARRTHPTYCFVVACIECLSVPLGTTLGVFTIITMTRPSVKELFEGG